MALFSAIKRVGAFIAGIPLTVLGGFLVYESFTGEGDNPLFSKFAWFILVFGLGLFLYSFSEPDKKPRLPAEPPNPDQKQF